MIAITVVLIALHIFIVIQYNSPRSPLDAIFGFSLKDRIIISTLFFIPIYLGTLLIWFLSVKIDGSYSSAQETLTFCHRQRGGAFVRAFVREGRDGRVVPSEGQRA